MMHCLSTARDDVWSKAADFVKGVTEEIGVRKKLCVEESSFKLIPRVDGPFMRVVWMYVGWQRPSNDTYHT